MNREEYKKAFQCERCRKVPQGITYPWIIRRTHEKDDIEKHEWMLCKRCEDELFDFLEGQKISKERTFHK